MGFVLLQMVSECVSEIFTYLKEVEIGKSSLLRCNYTVQKAKQQALSSIQSMGELYKLQMFKMECIMHKCIKKLLGNIENPGGEIKSLC